MKYIACLFLALSLLFSACQNQDWEFPDFTHQTVYFAHQYPVRTITLGEDIYDNSLDNEWKFEIMATTGGVYENENNIVIDVVVDNSLVDGMEFAGDENDIIAMPAGHYQMSSDQINIPKGSIVGGVEVQLTSEFFADPLAIGRNYVIPVRMTAVQNADSILTGTSGSEAPRRGVAGDWAVQPKDFTFYAVKFINPWHGYYLRRGKDIITGKNGNSSLDETIVRHEEYVEDDEVNMLTTYSLNEIEFPLVFKDSEGGNIDCSLILAFDEEGNCTVSAGSEDYTATGTGKFVSKGEKKSWGNQDRDAIYVSYEIDMDEIHVEATDTLVMRNRGVTMEVFTPVLE